MRIAWLALAIAVVHPAQGLGLPICWFRALTGVPCPGCGITRSMSCAVRGLFEQSWSYHPFGVFFLGFFCVVAIVSLLPARRRSHLAGMMHRCRRYTDALYVVLIASFIIFGFARAIAHMYGVHFDAAG